MEFLHYNGIMTIEEIKLYMKQNGISQIELADKSHISLQTLRKIFCGQTAHPRIDTMQAIENALGLQPKDACKTATHSIERTVARLQALPPDKKQALAAAIDHMIDAVTKE